MEILIGKGMRIFAKTRVWFKYKDKYEERKNKMKFTLESES